MTAVPVENKFTVGQFEGPLDLLLFLIKKQEINIYDIPIAKITEQYLAYMDYVARIELDNMTEFYLLASTLLYIKSRMLLPVDVNLDDEIEDPRKELVEKLIEYQKYKMLSELISEQEEKSEWLIERKRSEGILPFPDEDMWQQIDVWDLLKTFSTIISGLTPERIIDLYEEVTINEKVTLVHEILESRKEFAFTDLLRKERYTIYEVVCAFLAILELVKSREVTIYQNKMFGDIRIRASVGEERQMVHTAEQGARPQESESPGMEAHAEAGDQVPGQADGQTPRDADGP